MVRQVSSNSLKRNFVWTFAGNSIYAGAQWGILAVIARLSNPASVGRYALGLALTAPVFLLFGMQLRSVQATDASGEFRFSDYLAVRLIGMLAATAATVTLALTSGYDRSLMSVALGLGACKAIEGLCDVHYGLLQQREQMKPIAVSLILRGLLSIASMAIAFLLGRSVLSGVTLIAASWLAVLVLHDVPAARKLLRAVPIPASSRVCYSTLWRLVRMAGPLGVVMMVISVRANAPRYALERYAGVSAVGVFSALASLVLAGNMVIAALGQAASPRLARLAQSGDAAGFRRTLRRLLGVGAAIGLIGIAGSGLAGRAVITLLYGEHYAATHGVLVLLMLVGAIGYCGSFLGYAATAARRLTVQLPIFVATAAVTGGASLALVPRYGVVGAAWAWGAGTTLEFLAMAIVVALAMRAVQRQHDSVAAVSSHRGRNLRAGSL